MELVNNGKFYALTNVNGTTAVQTLTGLATTCSVLGALRNKYLIDGIQEECITIFTAEDSFKFKVWCYSIESDALYELFEETIDSTYLTPDRTVDCVNYPENGVDIIYFTDDFHEIRYIKCQIDNYTPNFLNSYEVSLLRKGATGTISLDEISSTGGSLLSGTYQFAYRMVDPTNKRFTKWSTLSNPIHIYTRDNGNDAVYADVGLQTSRKISLEIAPSEIELNYFDYIQVAVVENIFDQAPTTADILDIFPHNESGGIVSFEYKSNSSIGSIPLTDITVDLAQIKTVKTINVKQNRLFGGNIQYTELAVDSGVINPPSAPTIASLSAWVNAGGSNPGTWALSATPDVTLAARNLPGAISGYIAGTCATEENYQYSFTVNINATSGSLCTVTYALLDAGWNVLASANRSFFAFSGIANGTVLLTPSGGDGVYLAVSVTNDTPFNSKDFEIASVSYNAPALPTITGPTITSGAFIIAADSEDSYASDTFASEKVGHFRNEVYRYGIVYEDTEGNRSSALPLYLGALVTDNQITNGLPDVKFPDRSFSPTYSLLNSSGFTQAVGLSLTGVKNHPTWAASFEIVRLPRKKNILFQTPVIPMSQVNGIGAYETYPEDPVGGENPNAQPMTSGYTYIPKNLFWPGLRSMEKTTSEGGVLGQETYYNIGEIEMVRKYNFDYAMIFPTDSMYGAETPYQFTGTEKLTAVDFALLKLDATTFSTPTLVGTPTGDYLRTSTMGSFYAVGDGQYYFDSTTAGKSMYAPYINWPITDYAFFDNVSEPAGVGGSVVLDYAALQTEGISLGFQPSIQRCGVIRLQGPKADLTEYGAEFKNGNFNLRDTGEYIFGFSGPQYAEPTNDYVTSYAGYTNNSSNIGTVIIANVETGLDDARYGDLTSFGEYISTGAKYTFTQAERELLQSGTDVAVNIDVWGGDCYVGYHSFKVCDSTYSVVNQEKYRGIGETAPNLGRKWEKIYVPTVVFGGKWTLSMPVAVENSAQILQVCLESEYNGDVRGIDTIGMTTTQAVPHYVSDVEANSRVPLSYNYNINIGRGNSQKVYAPKPQYSFEQNDFQARVIYSDIKLYNSSEAGFDVVRVGNAVDLEESRYGITKLAVGFDHLYAVQERGVVYLPTGERQLEQTDGGGLAVRSGDIIGRPAIIDAKRGSQHLRGIVETGGIIYLPDNLNQSVYALANQELTSITRDNETEFRTFFASTISGADLVGFYDPVRRQYWLVYTGAGGPGSPGPQPGNPGASTVGAVQIFNDAVPAWVGSHEFTNLKSGIWADGLYLIGDNQIYTMYTGTPGVLFGDTVTPRVKCVINPDESISKTFDDIMISATQRLESIDLLVERESSLGDQIIPTISLDSVSVEGNYRVKVIRDGDNARARGLRAFATISWKAAVQSTLQNLNLKYRTSSRTPW